MLRNFLTGAVRSLRRQSGYAAINVVGLAIGIAVCLLIALFVRHELSYDDFHADADRIHRVVSDWGDFSVPSTNPPMVRALRTEWPSVPMARLLSTSGVVARGETQAEQDDLLFTGPGFFKVFSFEFVRGTPEDALARPYTAVLTPNVADTYFPNEDPVGQTLEISDQFEVEVTGIIEPAPETSHFHYDVLLSWATAQDLYEVDESTNWGNNAIYTYLKIPEDRSVAQMEAQLPDIRAAHGGANANTSTLSLQPLTSIHLYSHHNAELEANGRAAYVWIFAVIAGFVLVLACVNFTNLATARAIDRAREVGVRKSVGAGRGQLIRQFLGEAFALAGGALVVAVALVSGAMPLFRTLTGTTLSASVLLDPFTIAALLAITGIAALGAGAYPAFVLSRFDPVEVLRGRSREAGHGATLRKGLVVFQFATAVCLIAGTVVAYVQLNYLRSADLGFDPSQVVTLPLPEGEAPPLQRAEAWRQEVTQHASVDAASVASTRLPSELLSGSTVRPVGSGVPFDSIASFRAVSVGPGFFETLGVEAVAGRTFSPASVDTTGFVLNRTAYEMLASRLPEPPSDPEALVGRTIEMRWSTMQRGPLLGVVDDVHLSTLHEAVEPVVFFQDPDWLRTLYVRIPSDDVSGALRSIETTWERVFPAWPFEVQFVDAAFGAAYRAEQRMAQLFGVFAGLALFIAGLGLFGLAALTARQRTKEIGIRKALGASAAQIVGLLSKDFALLVVGAIVLALPVSYVALDRWLDTFAYRIDLGAGLFLGAGGAALLVALLTVSVQTFRAARVDPATTLRDE